MSTEEFPVRRGSLQEGNRRFSLGAATKVPPGQQKARRHSTGNTQGTIDSPRNYAERPNTNDEHTQQRQHQGNSSKKTSASRVTNASAAGDKDNGASTSLKDGARPHLSTTAAAASGLGGTHLTSLSADIKDAGSSSSGSSNGHHTGTPPQTPSTPKQLQQQQAYRGGDEAGGSGHTPSVPRRSPAPDRDDSSTASTPTRPESVIVAQKQQFSSRGDGDSGGSDAVCAMPSTTTTAETFTESESNQEAMEIGSVSPPRSRETMLPTHRRIQPGSESNLLQQQQHNISSQGRHRDTAPTAVAADMPPRVPAKSLQYGHGNSPHSLDTDTGFAPVPELPQSVLKRHRSGNSATTATTPSASSANSTPPPPPAHDSCKSTGASSPPGTSSQGRKKAHARRPTQSVQTARARAQQRRATQSATPSGRYASCSPRRDNFPGAKKVHDGKVSLTAKLFIGLGIIASVCAAVFLVRAVVRGVRASQKLRVAEARRAARERAKLPPRVRPLKKKEIDREAIISKIRKYVIENMKEVGFRD